MPYTYRNPRNDEIHEFTRARPDLLVNGWVQVDDTLAPAGALAGAQSQDVIDADAAAADTARVADRARDFGVPDAAALAAVTATANAAQTAAAAATAAAGAAQVTATGAAGTAAGAAQKANNLSDLGNAGVARSSLGLGGAALLDVGAAAGTVAAGAHSHVQGDVTGLGGALAGKAAAAHSHAETDVTGLAADLAGKAAASHTHAETDVTSLATDLAGKLVKASNLSDLASAGTARTNLGLGGAALLAVGTTTGTVAAGDDTRITGAAAAASALAVVQYDTTNSVWPARTTVTADTGRTVAWVGPTAPTIGGGGAVDGRDIWMRTQT